MTASRHLPARLASQAANGVFYMATEGAGAARGCFRRWRAVEGGLYGVDGAVKQLGRLLRQVVHHALAVVPRRRAAGGFADLGVHLLEFGAEVGRIGPPRDDLLGADAVLAVTGESSGGFV
jgi:hypothetical protein